MRIGRCARAAWSVLYYVFWAVGYWLFLSVVTLGGVPLLFYLIGKTLTWWVSGGLFAFVVAFQALDDWALDPGN